MATKRWTDHDWDGPDHGEINLGHNTTVSLWYLDEAHERPGGLWEWHQCVHGIDGPGGVVFDVPGNEDEKVRWTLHSLEPLHIEPSVACGLCGHHGFIRDGKWVSV
jgi:hypothetical protein